MTGSVTVEDRAADPLEKVLVFSKTAGFRHDSIPQGIAAIQAARRGRTASPSTRPRTRPQFTDANLAQYDVVVFLSTTGDVLNDAQQTAFERYIQRRRRLRRHPRRGRHRVHVALVRPDARRLLPQPPGRHAHRDGQHRGRQRALHDRDFPADWSARRTSGTTSSRRPTPVGQRRRRPTTAPRDSGVHVLATVDESTYDEDDGNTADDDHPIAWCSDFDGGRVWYTAHRPHAGVVLPSRQLPRPHPRRPGDRRRRRQPPTAARRARRRPQPQRLRDRSRSTTTPRARWSSPSPRTAASSTSSASPARSTSSSPTAHVVTAGRDPGLQRAGERPARHRARPELRRPTTTSTSPTRRCRTPRRRPASSRFTLNGDTLDTGVRAAHLPVQQPARRSAATRPARWPSARTATCTCRRATTPTRSPRTASTRSTSGPAARSGTPSARRPTRTTCSGKILRIKPLANPTGRRASARATRSRPATCSRGRGHAEQDPARDLRDGLPQPVPDHGRPEHRLGADGRLRPGRRRDEPEPRPAGQRRVQRRSRRATMAGRTASATTSRTTTTTSPPARPGPKFNCAAPVNNSPNNTGLTNLPPAKPATMWMGYTETDPRIPGLGTGGAPTGGPRYNYDPQPRLRHEVPGVLRQAVVHRRVEQRLDQDGHARRRPRRRSPTSSTTPWDDHVLPRRTRWSSGPTARST